jgi:uncharacterized membrane protein
MDASRLRRAYVALTIAVGLAGYAAMIGAIHMQWEWAVSATPVVEIVALGFCWAWAWNQTMPHRLPHAVVRTASLSAQPVVTAEWWLSTLPSLALPAAAGYILATHWSQVPARFAIHWGMDGQPNGWSDRSPQAVLWPLVMCVLLIGMMSLMGYLVGRFAPTASNPALMGLTLKLLRIVCWFIGLMFSGTALLPLSRDPSRYVNGGALAATAFAIGIIVYAVATIVRNKSFSSLQNTTSEQYWKGGIFYYNPDDAALFVPKRTGMGFTFNFARPAAWLFVLGILAISAGSLVFSVHGHAR